MNTAATNPVLFWHRRDLRISDNAGLYKALRDSVKVIPIFIFDRIILNKLPGHDQRVLFIYNEILRLKKEYQSFGSDLKIAYGDPAVLIPELARKYHADKVYTNRDYEPYALERDKAVFTQLSTQNIRFIGSKDHVIFEKDEVLKPDGTPYTIFTPYMKKWKERCTDFHVSSYPSEKYTGNLVKCNYEEPPVTLSDMGFGTKQMYLFPERIISDELIGVYNENRDVPSRNGTSRLSLHLRFGTISIRQVAQKAIKLNDTFLNELIWRDFYQMILFYFPNSVDRAFKKQYDAVKWVNNEEHFQRWCEGLTGYPMVDAGMRELNATGFMHNRLRMITACFLTKHLLTDWRWGEAYFAEKLLDYDQASNIGGWQWASGSGCDAVPYFRVFNPFLQQQKFDPEWEYIRKWVPEFGTDEYPEPIIEHTFARDRVLAAYKKALQGI